MQYARVPFNPMPTLSLQTPSDTTFCPKAFCLVRCMTGLRTINYKNPIWPQRVKRSFFYEKDIFLSIVKFTSIFKWTRLVLGIRPCYCFCFSHLVMLAGVSSTVSRLLTWWKTYSSEMPSVQRPMSWLPFLTDSLALGPLQHFPSIWTRLLGLNQSLLVSTDHWCKASFKHLFLYILLLFIIQNDKSM